jgi:hypothetical protein
MTNYLFTVGARSLSGLLGRLGRRQQQLSDRVHAVGDADAIARGWTVMVTVSPLGMGGRTYRDPRFDAREPTRSKPIADAAVGGKARQPVRLDQAISEWAQARGFEQLAGSSARPDDPAAQPPNRTAGA